MFKKIIAWALLIALTATAAVGGTLAYLTDRDSEANVFTVGNVEIDLNEDFEQGSTLIPGVDIEKKPTITNTGDNDAWVWAEIAIPAELNSTATASKNIVHFNMSKDSVSDGLWNWWKGEDYSEDGYFITEKEINGVPYDVYTVQYETALKPGDTTAEPLIYKVYLDTHVDIDPDGDWAWVEDGNATAIDWNSNDDGAPVIYVSAYAMQTEGFATVQAAYDAYQTQWGDNGTEWGDPNASAAGIPVTPDNIADTDFTQPNQKFTLSGEFEALTFNELGDGSVITFNNATVGALTINDDAVLSGIAVIDNIRVNRNSEESIKLALIDANLDVTNDIRVENTLGRSILDIQNTTLYAGNIFVGGHSNNNPEAEAEFNVIDSYISCEENGLGSTIAIWGQSGVDSKIIDSEIYTYSRGWHQSEDANDNAITFQSGAYINADIERSNMHFYGARSIINARKYKNDACQIDFSIDESLIWVVTKSNHGEETLPVWGATEITDSMLLFTKNVHQSTPAVFKSFVYGNPVIHGNYAVTTQCQWSADIALADNQIVTLAPGANVSIYDGAGQVNFVCKDAGQVVTTGATLTNIGVKTN